jgi:hypothetical protein
MQKQTKLSKYIDNNQFPQPTSRMESQTIKFYYPYGSIEATVFVHEVIISINAESHK